ncbi:MAG: hypothetical protein CMJ50_08070 [Planctomycetaceae bacterium]|nr:hypothetical protein [Planctomycetaceae bacterium]
MPRNCRAESLEVHQDPDDETSTCARLASTAKTADIIIEQRPYPCQWLEDALAEFLSFHQVV